MTAQVVLPPSTLVVFRTFVTTVAGFVGMWDVDRLIQASGQSPDTIDLLTCPVVPLMRVVAAFVNVSDALLMAILLVGNAAFYAAVAYILVRWLEQRTLTVRFPGAPVPRASAIQDLGNDISRGAVRSLAGLFDVVSNLLHRRKPDSGF